MKSGTPAEPTNRFNKSKAKSILNDIRAKRAAATAKAAAAPPAELNANLVAMSENPSSKIAQAKPVEAVIANVPVKLVSQNNKSNNNIEKNASFDDKYEETSDVKRMNELIVKIDKCKRDCEELNKQKKELVDFVSKKQIEGISLSDDKKLIDLLINIVLDTSDNWKKNIDTLINIPTSLGGIGFLRGGDYFEAIFQLAIAIGILPQFRSKFVRFYDIQSYKNIHIFENYLYKKTIKNSGGKETGVSDITFELSENMEFDSTKINKDYSCGLPPPNKVETSNPFYFISVKGYKKEKSIKDEYDIPLLDMQINELPEKINKHIIVCVKDKNKFLTRLSRSHIDFLKNSINSIIGYDEVIDAYSKFRIDFFNKLKEEKTKENIERLVKVLFPEKKIQKPMLSLYFHQELITKSVIKRIEEVKTTTKPHFLCIGVLPRGGKSFIAGGIIDYHKKTKEPYNVLFLTSAVNETRTQFSEDLIEKFSDFQSFDFIDVVGTKTPTSKPNKFYFISRQLSSMQKQDEESDKSILDEYNIMTILKEKLGEVPVFDICFFDEAHIGIASERVRSNFQKAFELFKIPIILMTATYKKPANSLESTKDLFVWDLQDIKDMKGLPILKIDDFINKKPDVLERYPDLAIDVLKRRISLGEDEVQITKPYIQFPNPNFISLTFTPDTIQHLKETASGYSFTQSFELNINSELLLDNNRYLEWHTMIRNRPEALRLRQFLTPEIDILSKDDKENPFLTGKDRKYRALNQIFSIAQKNGSRPMQGKPFSILMFLPFGFDGPNSKIGELSRVWASFMIQSSYWKENFVFLTLSKFNNKAYKPLQNMTYKLAVERGICHREDFNDGLKDVIINVEKEALKYGKGLVILSGDVAKMGISLKCVDVVFMMSNNTDADDIIQKMYRALTDDPPYKKDGFIVDLNLKRIITAMFEYDLEKDKLRIKQPSLPTTEERLLKTFELCNWGQDSYIEEHPEKNFNDIMNDIKTKVISDLEKKMMESFENNFRQIESKQKELIESDQELYRKVRDALKYTHGGKMAKKGKKILMGKMGDIIPAPEQQPRITAEMVGNMAVSAEAILQEKLAPAYVNKPELDDTTIQKKIIDIMKTFINSLVIKSAEPWTETLNLGYLLDKYKRDKNELNGIIPSCNCLSNENCKKNHSNLYEIAFCELKSYANENIGLGKYEYNDEIHKSIMNVVEDVFNKPSIYIEWNIYIEKLLKDMKESKSRKGGRRITRKKYNSLLEDGRRYTKKI